MKIASAFALTLAVSAFFPAEAKEVGGTYAPMPVVNIKSLSNGRVPVSNAASSFVPGISRSAKFNATASGAWSSGAVGPTMYQRGLWYTGGIINPIGGANSITTIVYYRWSASYRPAGLLVYLCNYARCVDVSSFQNAGTTAFAGDSAYSQFAFRFGVIGSGLLNPVVYGTINDVTVNYN